MSITIAKEIPKIENLVFKGSGMRWPAYLSAYETLLDAGEMDSVKRVAGSSGGALMATLLALGNTPDEIRKNYIAPGFTQFKEVSWYEYLPLIGGWIKLITSLYTIKNTERHGVNTGKALLAFLRKMVADKLGKPDATFRDLEEAIKKNEENGTDFKELYITACNLSQSTLETFSHKTDPDARIAESLFAAMAFPAAFQSVVLRRGTHEIVEGPVPQDDPNLAFYVDGGLYDNVPELTFYKACFKPEGYLFADVNPATLTFRVDEPDRFGSVLFNQATLIHPSQSLIDAYSYMLTTGNNISRENGHGQVQIRNPGVGTLDLDLDAVGLNKLYKEGKIGAENWLKTYRQVELQKSEDSSECPARPVGLIETYDSLRALATSERLTHAEKLKLLRDVRDAGFLDEDEDDADVGFARSYLSLYADETSSMRSCQVIRVEKSSGDELAGNSKDALRISSTASMSSTDGNLSESSQTLFGCRAADMTRRPVGTVNGLNSRATNA